MKFKHGHGRRNQRTPEYLAWAAAKKRCNNPNDPGWKDYGGRGIAMCAEWREDFQSFFRDMGKRPEGLTLERINNDGPYCKDNCKWATTLEQSKNKRPRRTSRFYTFNGETKNVTDWARAQGIRFQLLFERLSYGWTFEEALTRPVRRTLAK